MKELIKLRDLPGVERIEQLCRHPKNFEPPEATYNLREVDEVSISLFGVTEYDTWPDEDDDDDVELPYQVLDLTWPQGQPFWTAVGWDVTNVKGGEMLCLERLGRQIIAAVHGCVEGARFFPNGDGVAMSATEPLDRDEQESAEARLQAEADRFLKGRKG